MLAALVLALALTGCTRADQYVVVANDCNQPIIIDDRGHYGAVTIPAGDAADFTFEEEPPLTVDAAGRRPVQVDLRKWPETIRAGVVGEVVVTSAFCTAASPTPELELDDSQVIEDRYADRLVER
ncbi:hypothetical protein [uncultured Demequina sp.]|uniref:hypothetical protein n=1 Tax=uncultured Demequina sp. TaxID=693499 RepID=UPI0025EADE20|nr:hypothetical protein [uncultured Demequina sp.]